MNAPKWVGNETHQGGVFTIQSNRIREKVTNFPSHTQGATDDLTLPPHLFVSLATNLSLSLSHLQFLTYFRTCQQLLPTKHLHQLRVLFLQREDQIVTIECENLILFGHVRWRERVV